MNFGIINDVIIILGRKLLNLLTINVHFLISGVFFLNSKQFQINAFTTGEITGITNALPLVKLIIVSPQIRVQIRYSTLAVKSQEMQL